MGKHRPLGILAVSVLLILFGMAEVVPSFTRLFLLISRPRVPAATWMGALTGLFYCTSGILLLPLRRRLAFLSLLFLAGAFLGRIVMMVAGLYPMNSFLQSLAMSVGTSMAAFFAIYILLKWSSFK